MRITRFLRVQPSKEAVTEFTKQKVGNAVVSEIQDAALQAARTGKPVKLSQPGLGNIEVKGSHGDFFHFHAGHPDRVARKLSNRWFAPITINSVAAPYNKFATVEHYFNNRKFAAHPEFANRLAIGHPQYIGDDAGVVRRACQKKENAFSTELRDENVQPDPKFNDIQDRVMAEALKAKFDQHPDLKKLLLDTGRRGLLYKETTGGYWGCKYLYTGKKIDGERAKQLVGVNLLGSMLEGLRAEYVRELDEANPELAAIRKAEEEKKNAELEEGIKKAFSNVKFDITKVDRKKLPENIQQMMDLEMAGEQGAADAIRAQLTPKDDYELVKLGNEGKKSKKK
mmetsp:Transcript_4755/g.5156  ORF Transcript_4755/g.5156 Transcript_4755/m.5156 type:complete len:340 (+) Transcript_4755:85-1104(+)